MDVPEFIAGRFRIEGEIGRGGMGTVYRATHLGLERPVAVKIIKPEFAADRDVADRFLREARTMAKLRHPYAAMIFDAGNLPDGRHFIIMEFVEGTTLSEALAHEGRFQPERAVKIALQICEVLGEAHQLGIVHRDLKPSNIMLNERGVCVLDFGVAKVLATSTESTTNHITTGSGQIVGTPRYMSPEQCLGQRVGARSDLYSLGVVLYEMLAGRPPFIDPLPSAILIKQATVPAPPLPQLRQDIPKSLALAVHTMLAKRPEDRPRTAAVARVMLEKSLVRPARSVPQLDPLSSTMAVVAEKGSMLFRVAAPLATIVFFGALFFVWGNSGESASRVVDEPVAAAQLSADNLPFMPELVRNDTRQAARPIVAVRSAPSSDVISPPSLAPDRARSIAAAISSNSDGIQILQTASGPMVAAIQYVSRSGLSRFLVMERRGEVFRVSLRGQLETKTFRHAQWTAETVDADGDDYDEVLFTGIDVSGRNIRYRYVLYVPKNRKTYVLEFESKRNTSRLLKVAWSKSVFLGNGQTYSKLLREKANRAIARMRSR